MDLHRGRDEHRRRHLHPSNGHPLERRRRFRGVGVCHPGRSPGCRALPGVGNRQVETTGTRSCAAAGIADLRCLTAGSRHYCGASGPGAFGIDCRVMAGSGWHLRDGVKSNLVEGKLQVVERDADGRPLCEIIDATDELGRTLHAEGRTTNLLKLSVYGIWFDWYGLAGWEFDGVPADAAEPPRRRLSRARERPADLRLRGSGDGRDLVGGLPDRRLPAASETRRRCGGSRGHVRRRPYRHPVRADVDSGTFGSAGPFIGVVSTQMKRIEGGNSPLTYARSRWAPC